MRTEARSSWDRSRKPGRLAIGERVYPPLIHLDQEAARAAVSGTAAQVMQTMEPEARRAKLADARQRATPGDMPFILA